MEKLAIIKIGGAVIDDEVALNTFLKQFNSMQIPKILVHGGGKTATALAVKLGIEQTIVDGRRITDAATLPIITMVYSGWINKNIVAKLQALQCNALGLSGADANLITAEKRNHPTIDYGFVGDIKENGISVKMIKLLLDHDIVPIVNSITHDGKGQLLNTNADTIAATIAIACSALYYCSLIYCFEKNGVLTDIEKDSSFLPVLNKKNYLQLQQESIINKGMVPKLDNAFNALEHGVQEVRICNAAHFSDTAVGTKITF